MYQNIYVSGFQKLKKNGKRIKHSTCATVGPAESSHTVTEPRRSAYVARTPVQAHHDVTNVRLAVRTSVLVRTETRVRVVLIQTRAVVLTRHISAIVDTVNVWSIQY